MTEITTVQPAARDAVLSYLSLFTSFATLLCCALPSLLVLFGLGATVASFLSAAPWITILSRHKDWVFATAGLLIAGNFIYTSAASRRRARELGCSLDDPRACAIASKFSRIILWTSAVIYTIGFFTAYILGPLLMRFGG